MSPKARRSAARLLQGETCSQWRGLVYGSNHATPGLQRWTLHPGTRDFSGSYGRGSWKLKALGLADTMAGHGCFLGLANSLVDSPSLTSLDLRWNHLDAGDEARRLLHAAWVTCGKPAAELYMD